MVISIDYQGQSQHHLKILLLLKPIPTQHRNNPIKIQSKVTNRFERGCQNKSALLLVLLLTRKAPGALDPTVVLPPTPPSVKYVTVTQEKSPCLCSERHNKYLFGRAKTGGLGQVTTKKKKTRKAPGALDPAVVLSPPPPPPPGVK